MPVEVTLLIKRRVTQVTFVRFLSAVYEAVTCSFAGCCKHFGTRTTWVRFLARMRKHVNGQMLDPLLAHGAL